MDISRICSLVNFLQGSSFHGQPVLVNDTEDFFFWDGPKCMYEVSKGNATNYSERFEGRIKSNFPIGPAMEMPVIPSRI